MRPSGVEETNAVAVAVGQPVALTTRLERICEVVHPSNSTFDAFGHEIRNLLILACTEVESQWRDPLELNNHRCIGSGGAGGQNAWHFSRAGDEAIVVRPSGPLRVNSGDALLPSLYAGVGIALLPEFLVADGLADGRLERLLPDWISPGGAVHWVTPPGGKRPMRVEVLGAFFARHLSRP